MADKRFWSGATIVMTVAVAGAGVMPTLLLRPAAEPIPFEQTFTAAAAVSRPAEPGVAGPKVAGPKPTAQSAAEPKAAPAKPAPAASPPAPAVAAAPAAAIITSAPAALSAPRQAAPQVAPQAAPPQPAPAQVIAAPPPAPAAATPVAPAEPPRQAPAEAFPPVQPVGIAPRRDVASDAAGHSARPRQRTGTVARKWARLARGRVLRVARRGGNVRPATYPIREFLAWRR